MPRDDSSRPPSRSGAPGGRPQGSRGVGPKRDGVPRDSSPRDSSPGDSSQRGRPSRSGGSERPQRPGRPGTSGGGGYKGRPENARHGRGGDRTDRPERREGNTPGRERPEIDVPDIPDEVTFDQLDKAARARLRTLSKDNAEDVGRHLVMAGKFLDVDVERAYKHAQVALARGGRVDVVREAAAITAYATGRYAEALKEFRTVKRLSGVIDHLPLMADCERGLGRPERAIALAGEPEARQLDAAGQVELSIVVAGARLDMGDPEAALVVLNRIAGANPQAQSRIDEARIDVLRALGRHDEADQLASTVQPPEESEETWADEVFIYDTEELSPPAKEQDQDQEDAP